MIGTLALTSGSWRSGGSTPQPQIKKRGPFDSIRRAQYLATLAVSGAQIFGSLSPLRPALAFDIPALAQFYSKSHTQVLLRIGEALQGERFFCGALYEPDPTAREVFRVNCWIASANERETEANFFGPGGFFPQKGQAATFESLVDRAIDSRRPYY